MGVKNEYRHAINEEYPEDWKQVAGRLADWIQKIASLYRDRIEIRVFDAQSPIGFWKQIRHRVFRFPAFIIDKRSTYIGWDSRELQALIDERIGNRP